MVSEMKKDPVDKRPAPYQMVMRAVLAKRARLDCIEAIVQPLGWQEEELAYSRRRVGARGHS